MPLKSAEALREALVSADEGWDLPGRSLQKEI
jgi:hypothetical protein